ncbi:M4 family metallopeptidase [Mucilaginibacter sp. HMF5004]|uniref:M4 family metallopeptidase n=1 Tax=Mucilaginibacter rivuli TaxID=2857527 RepID=UPI001C605689|nr:M4 family metallopeptidase [Mucilaginibacter rivuli]MBW4890553.1 M4 family metallopeptidase [Mucilaginibacter rivuli]
MKTFTMLKKVMVLTIIGASQLAHAQLSKPKVEVNNKGLYAKNVDFGAIPDKAPNFTKGEIILYTDSLHSKVIKASRLLSQESNVTTGYSYYKWQQTVNGVPVENAQLIQHVKNGKLTLQRGNWVQDTTRLSNSSASLSPANAIDKALQYINAKTYQWQIPAEEKKIQEIKKNASATYYPKPELVYYSGEGVVDPSNLKLAYKMDIFAHYPFTRQIVFVDAKSGAILGKRDLIIPTDVTGTAQTVYSGTHSITVNYTGSYPYPSTYILNETTTRGNGINTFNMGHQGDISTYASIPQNNSTTFTVASGWGGDVQYCLDAHWGQEQTYDFYKNNFNRNSIDGAGYIINGFVNTDLPLNNPGYPNSINAFWDGTEMVYGWGGTIGTTTVTPLVTLDIIGHEITHGLTAHTSNLAYTGESGALNESFSDMMGTAIEFYGNPGSANWTIGENIGITFRSMANPKAYSQPDTYGGTNWQSTSNSYDNYGVHTNSGVGNKWFYLLSMGGQGTNDLSNSYSVIAIGLAKAQAIAYETFTHLMSTDQYIDCRTASIAAAATLYGANSLEVIEVTNAWYAVGVGSAYQTQISGTPVVCSTSVYSVNSLPSGATVAWSIPSGAGPVLQLAQNSPSTNQLTITNQHWYGVTTVLTAVVSVSGSVVATYNTPIMNDNSNSISASYTQDACTFYGVSHPAQSGYASTSQSTFVHQGCMVHLSLYLPPNKTVTVGSGGGTPDYFYYSGGILNFSLPIGSGGVPFYFNITPTVNDGSCSSYLVFFTYSNNQNAAMRYSIAPNPVGNTMNIIANDNATSTNSLLLKTATPESTAAEQKRKSFQFNAKIYDVIQNKLLLTKKSNPGEMFQNIDVSSLKPGYYVLIIEDGDKPKTINFIKE